MGLQLEQEEITTYIEAHPNIELNEQMFDFTLTGGKRRRKPPVAKKVPEVTQPVATVVEEKLEESEPPVIEDEANPNSLKILFEDDAYKCPIEGCGKNFRRENLAQMHVKHYHPEYTKFLDSTPNVADLAYARTVGENLDKSPGPSRPPVLKPAVRTLTPKSKSSQSPLPEAAANKPQSPSLSKPKDTEIIKLLNTKPFDKKDIEPYPAPLNSPASHPDIKLRDILAKSESVPKQDDLIPRLALRQTPGIKTLLPVVRPPPVDTSTDDSAKQSFKRKRGMMESVEIIKGKETQQQPTATTPSQPSFPSQTSTPLETPLQSEPPAPPANNIIIEGGEVIKIVRMRQEEIINCTCGFTEEDGLMIQCELCLCWQHAYCNNIERESQVPEKYICYICQHPLRERTSRKYFHDQEWLKQGGLPTGSYHSKENEVLQRRFEKLRKCHDLSGGLLELRDYMHSLSIKMKIAEAKNHPKLYLWSKPWLKKHLPEKVKQEGEVEETKPKTEDEDLKSELELEKQEPQSESMLMMILKAGKEVIPKLDLNSLMDNNMSGPIIPQPEAAIDSADCRLNLLEHIVHEESLVEERLDEFEKQIEALEEGWSMETDPNYPKMRQTLEMLNRDLCTLKEFSQSLLVLLDLFVANAQTAIETDNE
ncbi:hypothetical protein NQ317_017699 [Molorchus minor]|uniref:C2H2-type domain-containing protein n=1 Tax=Molorchus minor TaxID=1323400 RepID=A0ABQ9JQP8_9CUCU|nr:hypothetical protein NQ317_017699 [Molorchus minor]